MKEPILFIALVLTICQTAIAANILALLTIASPSHHIWNSPLLVSLANRGHNVTIISSQAQKKPVPNLTDLVVPGLIEGVAENYDYVAMTEISDETWMEITVEFTYVGCKIVLESEEFKRLMEYPPEFKFDLIIIEAIGCECLFGIVHKFGNPPIVALNGLKVPIWVLRQTGTPYFPSHMPYLYSLSTDRMRFLERVYNFWRYVHGNYLYYYQYLPNMDKLAKEFFGNHIPSVEETSSKLSLVLSNFHPSLDYAWGKSPSLIPVAGIQIKDPKPLTQELQKFLDGAKNGAIFFSLGSNVRSDSLSDETRSQILAAFAELPQRVLWKFESDITNLPPNVKVGKWLPQTDILAHPNVKLFITHAGGLSTHETIYRGVPVVAIPFLGDQFMNSRLMQNHGGGVELLFKHVTKDTLLKAIRTVLDDPSYAENMKALSERFRDDPETALERAVFWTEYVIRHKGAPHLRSAAMDLNMIQYLLLDVIALLIAVPTTILMMCYCLCCRKKYKIEKKVKKN